MKKEIARSTDIRKLLAAVNVYVYTGAWLGLTLVVYVNGRFCGLLQFPVIRGNTLQKLMILLCHTFPTVSIVCAHLT